MAKSLFEPKKITRYANNQELIEGGLAGAPTPRISTGTSNFTGGSVDASITPAPVQLPGETRAFVFDGSTELVADYPDTGNSRYGTTKLTFTPGWSQTETGSFALYTIGTSGSNDYRVEVSIVRSSGSAGYLDQLSYKVISGSAERETLATLASSPNTYAGAIQYSFLQIHHSKQNPGILSQGTTRLNERTRSGSGVKIISNFTESLHQVSIGGLNSGSEHYFSGSINQFAHYQSRNLVQPRLSAQDFTGTDFLKMYYRFEGTVSASLGNDLTAVGTQTFVSSSL